MLAGSFFSYDGIKCPYARLRWFLTISDGPDEDIGMWIVQPDFDAIGWWSWKLSTSIVYFVELTCLWGMIVCPWTFGTPIL